jgi:hypothetical protein
MYRLRPVCEPALRGPAPEGETSSSATAALCGACVGTREALAPLETEGLAPRLGAPTASGLCGATPGRVGFGDRGTPGEAGWPKCLTSRWGPLGTGWTLTQALLTAGPTRSTWRSTAFPISGRNLCRINQWPEIFSPRSSWRGPPIWGGLLFPRWPRP